MNVTLPKRALATLLNRVLPAVDPKAPMQIITLARVEAKPDRLELFATDLSISIATSEPCEVSATGVVCINPRDLLAKVLTMPDGNVSLTLKDARLKVKSQTSKREFSQVISDPEGFPSQPSTDAEPVTVDAKALATILARVAPAVGTDKAKSAMQTVLVEASGGVLRAVATNGHACFVAEEPSTATLAPIMVPRKAAATIVKQLAGETSASIRASNADIHVTPASNNTTLTFKMVDDVFPPWRQIVPTEFEAVLSIPRAATLDAFQAVSVSTEFGRVTMSVSSSEIVVQSETVNGDARDSIPIAYDGKPATVGINGSYAMDALGSSTADSVELKFSDEKWPIVFQTEGTMCLVMPMRV